MKFGRAPTTCAQYMPLGQPPLGAPSARLNQVHHEIKAKEKKSAFDEPNCYIHKLQSSSIRFAREEKVRRWKLLSEHPERTAIPSFRSRISQIPRGQDWEWLKTIASSKKIR